MNTRLMVRSAIDLGMVIVLPLTMAVYWGLHLDGIRVRLGFRKPRALYRVTRTG